MQIIRVVFAHIKSFIGNGTDQSLPLQFLIRVLRRDHADADIRCQSPNGRQRLVRLQFTGYDLILDLIDDLLVDGIRSMRFNDDYQSHVSSFVASS